VTYFVTGVVLFVLAEQQIDTNISDIQQLENLKLITDELSLNIKLPEAQRRKDPVSYYSKPKQLTDGNYREFGKHRYAGSTNSKLQRQINRPFKQYGPPSQENLNFPHENNQQISISNNLNQEALDSKQNANFMKDSPIASQNNLPFGQHTANYLPPKNQELPTYSTSHYFSNQNHDFPHHNQYQHQQQQYNTEQQQQQYDSQQHQQLHNDQQQQHLYQQLLNDKQHFILQNVEPNLNSGQNIFPNQQISDAALFLSENAQAISNLYGAPADNENYAPNNQNFVPIHHNEQESQSLRTENLNNYQLQQFPNFLPSYASGILNSHESFEKVQSLDRERLIAQLQQALSNQQSSQLKTENKPIKFHTEHNTSFNNYQPFSASTSTSSLEGFFGSSVPSLSTHTSISSPSTELIQPNRGGSVIENTQIETTFPASGTIRPSIPNPETIKFEPSLVPTANFVPSLPIYQIPLPHSTSLKSTSNSPTYFGIPIPTYNSLLQPSSKVAAITSKPSNNGYFNSVRSSITQPNPFPIVASSTQIYPSYGINSAALNSASVYQPVKAYPFHYYPNTVYQQLQKPVGLSGSANVWSYAPSFA
jgi:hypothetical protein